MFVYLIQQDQSGFVKIGISGNVTKRLRDLQSANPHLLSVKYTVNCPSFEIASAIEKRLHNRFATFRLTNEWFNVPIEKIIADLEWGLSFSGLNVSPQPNSKSRHHSTNGPQLEAARKWLRANPDYKSVRKAAFDAGVSVGTMQTAIKESKYDDS